MPKPKIHRLGDLQLKIMKILWEQGESAVAAVHDALGGSAQFAHSTVATMLRKMETRGLLAHRTEGRSYIYRTRVREKEVSRRMSDHLLDRLFDGSLTEAVNHLLTTREVSREELGELERLIAERKKKL
jgi:predicted transcriptional regulator